MAFPPNITINYKKLNYAPPRITALKGLQPIKTGCKDNAFIWIDNKKVGEILVE